jgi:hypothetical protein
LNHFTVPVAMFSSTAYVHCERGGSCYGNDCGR